MRPSPGWPNTANFTSKLSEEDQQLVFDLVEQACKEVKR